jgi:hypothetical protein
MIIDPVVIVAVFAIVLLVWAVALFLRTMVSDSHIWFFSAAYCVFFALLFLAAEQRSF